MRYPAFAVACATSLMLAGCALPVAPAPLPSTFISAAPTPATAGLIDGFSPVERIALRVRGRTCAAYVNGTAWMLDATHAVTNRHVVEGASAITLTGYDGTEYTAGTVRLSTRADLALVTVKEAFPEVATVAVSEPSIGDTLTFAGYPGGSELTTRSGPFVSVAEDTVGSSTDTVYAIEAESHPGNSGSPVVNADGAVTGVLYASNNENYTLAVSQPTLERFIAQPGETEPNRTACG